MCMSEPAVLQDLKWELESLLISVGENEKLFAGSIFCEHVSLYEVNESVK